MRRWIWTFVLGMAAVAVWALPIAPDADSGDDTDPKTRRFLELQSEVLLEREHIRRLDWLDSLTALLHSGETPSAVLAVPPQLRSDTLSLLDEQLRSEIANVDRPLSDFGAFVIPAPEDRPPDDPAWRLHHAEYYVGRSGGRPYCFYIQFTDETNAKLRNAWPLDAGIEMLAACAYAVRYGEPGPLIAGWLKEGSLARGVRRSLPPNAIRELEAREVFSQRLESGALLSLAAHRCLEGETDSCTDIFLNPKGSNHPIARQLADRIPELWSMTGGTNRNSLHLGIIEEILLADLEREFGAERFAHFWTSGAEVTAAFQQAFGTSAGEWVHRWARGYYVQERSLRAGLANWAATIIVLVAAFVSVLITVSRRRVA